MNRHFQDAGEPVKEFFETYEKGNNSSEFSFVESHYAEVFQFAGPAGVQTVKRSDFLQVLPKMKGFYRNAGLVATRLLSLHETILDERYVMVKVIWQLFFEGNAGETTIDAPASYILPRNDPRIIFQLDHQDLMKTVQSRL